MKYAMLEVFRPNFSSIQRVYYESNLNFSSIQRLNFYEDDKVSEAPSNDVMLPPKSMPHISCSRQQTICLRERGTDHQVGGSDGVAAATVEVEWLCDGAVGSTGDLGGLVAEI
jgi:hypothetical protein